MKLIYKYIWLNSSITIRMSMISLEFPLIRDLLAQNEITFVWRTDPGNEDRAVVTLPTDIRLEPFSMFISAGSFWSMGSFSYSQSSLPAETYMGRYCSCAHAVNVFNSEHPVNWISTSPFAYDPDCAPIFERALAKQREIENTELFIPEQYDDRRSASIRMGNDVWIGQHVLLRRGITIHDGAVIAAGSVVTRDVEEFMVVGGVPAKPIKKRFPDKIIARIKDLCWWDYKFTDFAGLDVTKPEVFLDRLERKLEQGRLSPYSPNPVTLQDIKAHIETILLQ